MPNLQVKALYTCTQQELYLGSENVLTNCAALQASFTKRFPSYTGAYIDSVRTLLNDAKALPDYQNRDSKTEILGGKAKEKMEECLDEEKFLKAYIEQAYEKDPITLKAKLEAAGFNLYTKAGNGNAEAGIRLVEASITFLQDPENRNALKNYMPDTFAENLKKLNDELIPLYNQRPIAEQNKKGETINKVEANNLLYTEISKICDHGKLIFAKDPINYPKFVWDTVIKLVGGERPTKLQGYVKDKATGLPIQGAEVESSDEVYMKISDAEGRYEFAQITGGTHNFAVRKEGYKEITIEVNLETGVTKNLSFELEKI